ncbi:MAG: NAD(P)-binding domain-containing protein, partial [Ornithinimicrobium sp.]
MHDEGSKMSAIAFIGLGIMGGPMAGNLVRAGHQVTGFNRSPGPYATLEEAGGKAVSSCAEATRDADFICVMVPDSPDVEEVLTGEGGVFD